MLIYIDWTFIRCRSIFMANPNLQLLTDAARLLKPILGELVFVGGIAGRKELLPSGAPAVCNVT
jgi:hypothetical protein